MVASLIATVCTYICIRRKRERLTPLAITIHHINIIEPEIPRPHSEGRRLIVIAAVRLTPTSRNGNLVTGIRRRIGRVAINRQGPAQLLDVYLLVVGARVDEDDLCRQRGRV